MGFVIGVDTGGTFTDAVVIEDSGLCVAGKAPTTPEDLVQGLLASVSDAAEKLDKSTSDLLTETRLFRYSGTTAINALLTRSGATVGLITTQGFEDTIFIARAVSGWAGLAEEQVRRAWGHRKPSSIVPKRLVRGLPERIDWSGSVVSELDEELVQKAAEELVAAGAESIAICLLWSVRNGDHEQRVRELVLREHPDLFVSVSHEVAPTMGEYERFVTAAINAYVGPRLSAFLSRFEQRLGEQGFSGDLLVSQSDGGSLYFEETKPVYTLRSGPAAGIIASRTEGDLLGYENVVTTDVGGTSFDVGLVADGDWVTAREPVVDSFHVSFPMIEVESIGAGGGSIASRDEGGALVVGPESAGSSPGPACYGQGGTKPTVTDAAVVLGYLNPDFFLGGKINLERGLAESAIAGLAEELGMSPLATAAGIFEIANTHMSGLVTRRVLSRGYDPRDFVLFAYGGAGPVHAAFYASEIGVKKVVVPALAGTFSALGVASGPLHHSARSIEFASMPMPAEAFNRQFETLAESVSTRLARDVPDPDGRRLAYAIDMRYGVQVHTVKLPLEPKHFDDGDIEDAARSFDALYERLFGRGSGFVDAGRFVTSFVVDGFGDAPVPDRSAVQVDSNGDGSRSGERQVYFDGEMQTALAYLYDRLNPGDEVDGPAVLDASSTTVVIPPGQRATLDKYRNVHIELLSATG